MKTKTDFSYRVYGKHTEKHYISKIRKHGNLSKEKGMKECVDFGLVMGCGMVLALALIAVLVMVIVIHDSNK